LGEVARGLRTITRREHMKIRFTRETLVGLVVLAGALMVASLSATATAGPTSVTCDGQPATIVGTAHDDSLTGTAGDDVAVAP
jgi:hypothetical protein